MEPIILDKINLKTMTWREVIDTIEGNMSKLQMFIADSHNEVYIEQFEGAQISFTLKHEITDDCTLFVFRGNEYIGGRTGKGYTLKGQKIIVDSALENDEYLTVQFLYGSTMTNFTKVYLEKYFNLNYQIGQYLLMVEDMVQGAESLKRYIDDTTKAIASEDQIKDVVENWLVQHPEATTTVEDNSVTESKIADGSVTLSKLEPSLKKHFINSHVLVDSETGLKYSLCVTDGNLCIKEVSTDEAVGFIPLVDTKTGKNYELRVNNGEIVLRQEEV